MDKVEAEFLEELAKQETVDEHLTDARYLGSPCPKCANRTRYNRRSDCVRCRRIRKNARRRLGLETRWSTKEEEREYKKNWKRNNREKVRASKSKRRALKKKCKHRPYRRKDIKNKYPYCLSCFSTSKLTIDHVVPISHGGADAEENLQVLCSSCNSSKGANYIEYRTMYLLEEH